MVGVSARVAALESAYKAVIKCTTIQLGITLTWGRESGTGSATLTSTRHS